jgi:CRISPR-associated endonuclease/helicase Cas3
MAGLTEGGLLDAKVDTVPRTADDGAAWMATSAPDGEAAPPVIRFRVRTVEEGTPVSSGAGWRERLRFATEMSDEGEAIRWLVVEGWGGDVADEDERSVTAAQLLEEHERRAERYAHALAKRLGLRASYANMLAVSARLHDEGKALSRWQRAFNAPDARKVYAKTPGPVNQGLLDGYRHEFGTILLVDSNGALRQLDDGHQDLARHMIAAHHGFARPSIRTRGCDDAPPSVLEERAQQIALSYARLQERWGPWGLAWWEALLRAADQQASRDSVPSLVGETV